MKYEHLLGPLPLDFEQLTNYLKFKAKLWNFT